MRTPSRSRCGSAPSAVRRVAPAGVSGDPRLVEVILDESAAVHHGADEDHERRVAIFDLVEENYFAPKGVSAPGPYRLRVSRAEGRLILAVDDEAGEPQLSATISLASIRRILRDYETMCESYHEAIKTAPRARIEAIDMGRRGLHNEGSEILRDALADKIALDEETARRLFTLVHALHIRL